MAGGGGFRDPYANGLPCFQRQIFPAQDRELLARAHQQVLAAAQTFLSDLLRIQGDARKNVFTGQAAVLNTFAERMHSAPQQLTQLKLLTFDNPEQQQRLRPIGPDLDEVIAFSQQLVDTRNTYGIQAAFLFESDGQRMAAMDRTLADLQAFTDEEHRLLNERSEKAEVDFHHMELLLMFGSILAALLLVLANLMSSRALAAQKKLTHAPGRLNWPKANSWPSRAMRSVPQ